MNYFFSPYTSNFFKILKFRTSGPFYIIWCKLLSSLFWVCGCFPWKTGTRSWWCCAPSRGCPCLSVQTQQPVLQSLAPVLPGAGKPPWTVGLDDCPGGRDRVCAGNASGLCVLGVFSFLWGFCFCFFNFLFCFLVFLSTFTPTPGIMRHVLFNIMQWTYTKIHLVSATPFFLMQYIHL